MPGKARTMKNPIVLTPAMQREAMAHYADHCAACHADDGRGQTMFGRRMYLRPPDLRSETSIALKEVKDVDHIVIHATGM